MTTPFGPVFGFPPGRTTRPDSTASNVANVYQGGIAAAMAVPAQMSNLFVPGIQRSKMRALVNGQRQDIFDRNTSFSSNGQFSDILSGHQSESTPEGAWSVSPPTDEGDLGNQSNVAVPQPRILSARQAWHLPGQRELVFIHKPKHYSARMSTAANIRFRPPGAPGAATPSGMYAGGKSSEWSSAHLNALNRAHRQQYEDADVVDMNPMQGANLRYLNEIFWRAQEWLFLNDVESYIRLDPLKIWHGLPGEKFLWTGWHCDGIARYEEIHKGPSSRDADGLGAGVAAGVYGRGGGPGRASPVEKMYSVVRAGRVQAMDIFESRGIWVGASHNLVLTKHKLPLSGALNFITSSKSGTLSQEPYATQFSLVASKEAMTPATTLATMAKYTDKQRAIYAAMTQGFSPYLLHAVTSPDCGPLNMSFNEYVDEFGHERCDALCMMLGRTMFEPFDYLPQPPVDTPASPGFKPHVNGAEAMTRQPFPDVLLRPCKDGIISFF